MANRIWVFGIAVAIFLKINCTKCENILYLSTVPSPSHEIWLGKLFIFNNKDINIFPFFWRNRVLAKGLQKQHNVTFLSTEPGRNLGPNVHTIYMEEVQNELLTELTPADFIEFSDANPFDEFVVFNKFCTSTCSGKAFFNFILYIYDIFV